MANWTENIKTLEQNLVLFPVYFVQFFREMFSNYTLFCCNVFGESPVEANMAERSLAEAQPISDVWSMFHEFSRDVKQNCFP